MMMMMIQTKGMWIFLIPLFLFVHPFSVLCLHLAVYIFTHGNTFMRMLYQTLPEFFSGRGQRRLLIFRDSAM
jgi:hypothetical protein